MQILSANEHLWLPGELYTVIM